MAKFSEIPFFLLDKYFTDRDNNTTIDLYIYDDDNGYRKAVVYPIYQDEKFLFKLSNSISIENGSQVYFKKDSEFHTWLLNTADSYYKTNWWNSFDIENYCNINPTFLYFGTIYGRDEGTVEYNYLVDYVPDFIIDYLRDYCRDYTASTIVDSTYQVYQLDLKDFIKSSLPQHQRTDRIKLLIETYYDKIHSEIYSLMRNINTLIDPLEINEDYLEYLAFLYKFTLSDQFDVSTKRNFIRNLVDTLKRKGTYSSIFDFWVILTDNTENKLNIYERWHDPDIVGLVTESQYVDYLYLHPYITRDDNLYLPGGVGKFYYKQFIPGVADLEPGAYISVVSIASNSWEINHGLDTTGVLVQCYNTDFERMIPSKIEIKNADEIEISFSEAVDGYAFIRSAHKTSSNWVFSGGEYYTEHTSGMYLNTQMHLSSEVIIPGLTRLANNSVYSDVPGTIQLLAGEKFGSGGTSTTWTITHAKNKTGLIVNAYDQNNEVILPNNVTLATNTLEMTWSAAVSGYIVLSEVGDPSSLFKSPYNDDLLLSPHYIVEIDVTDEALHSTKIIDADWHNDLIDYWELMRPVDRVSHYRLIVSPIGKYNGNWYNIYSGNTGSQYISTKFVGSDPTASLLTFTGDNLTSPYFEVYTTQTSGSSYEYKALVDQTYYQSNNYYYLICDIPTTEPEYTIREIRLKDLSDNTIFITRCSDIEKLTGITMRIVYRIEK